MINGFIGFALGAIAMLYFYNKKRIAFNKLAAQLEKAETYFNQKLDRQAEEHAVSSKNATETIEQLRRDVKRHLTNIREHEVMLNEMYQKTKVEDTTVEPEATVEKPKAKRTKKVKTA